MEVQIQFDLPISAAGKRILRLCKSLSGFSQSADGLQIVVNSSTLSECSAVLPYLWKVIQGRPGTILTVDGQVRDRQTISAIITTMACFQTCGMYESQREYCCQFGPGISSWGCRQLRSVARYSETQLRADSYWYQIGPFLDSIQWVDKAEIQTILEREAERSCCALCPYFSMARIQTTVKTLPEYIDPAEDTDWVLRYPLDPAETRKAIGVRPADSLDRLERIIRDCE